MKILENIRIVLVEPTHPGNIGAVARSMKTMGLNQLVMVNPKKFPHYEATKRAAGADSVLQAATLVENLSDAIEDCTLVYGTSVRDREVSWPTLDPRQAAVSLLDHINIIPASISDTGERPTVAILFGRESSGLANEELDRCQAQIRISANQDYSSLNLASAVQIISYELRVRALQLICESGESASVEAKESSLEARRRTASTAQREGHMEHLKETLLALDFVKTRPPTLLMRKLTRLYNKADLSVEEIQILRGILSAVQAEIKKRA